MRDTFTILDTGETLITGEWVPGFAFDDVEARLIGLSRSLDNLAPVLIEARELARQSTEAHFDSQTDPSGRPWTPLSLEWLEDKRKSQSAHPDEILQLSGAGKDAATSEEAYFITEGEIWFNPNVMPVYMAYHQRGTASGTLESAVAKIRSGEEFTAEEAATISSETGRGKGLPKREFVGFDEIDILALEEAFNTWFAANVMEFFPEGPSRTQTGFNVLGEFPIVGFTKRGQPLLRTPAGIRFGRMTR